MRSEFEDKSVETPQFCEAEAGQTAMALSEWMGVFMGRHPLPGWPPCPQWWMRRGCGRISAVLAPLASTPSLADQHKRALRLFGAWVGSWSTDLGVRSLTCLEPLLFLFHFPSGFFKPRVSTGIGTGLSIYFVKFVDSASISPSCCLSRPHCAGAVYCCCKQPPSSIYFRDGVDPVSVKKQVVLSIVSTAT